MSREKEKGEARLRHLRHPFRGMDYLERLRGVDPRLIAVLVKAAREFHKFYPQCTVRITDGQRTLEQQQQRVLDGVSWTMDSEHLKGRAVDVAILIGDKPDWELHWYSQYNVCVQKEAEKLGVTIQWGGDWTQKDGCHFELVLLKGRVV